MDNIPPVRLHIRDEWRVMYGEALHYENELRNKCFQDTMRLAIKIQSEKLMIRQNDLQITRLTAELEQLKSHYGINFDDNAYKP